MTEYTARDVTRGTKGNNLVPLHNNKLSTDKAASAPILKWLTAFFLHITTDRLIDIDADSQPADDSANPNRRGKSKRPVGAYYNSDDSHFDLGPGYYVKSSKAIAENMFEKIMTIAFEPIINVTIDDYYKQLDEVLKYIHNNVFIVQFLLWGRPTDCHVYRLGMLDLINWLKYVLVPIFEDVSGDKSTLDTFIKAIDMFNV